MVNIPKSSHRSVMGKKKCTNGLNNSDSVINVDEVYYVDS